MLEENFKLWRKSKITAFELNELIHKFHNGIARDLWSFYDRDRIEIYNPGQFPFDHDPDEFISGHGKSYPRNPPKQSRF